MDKSKMHSSPNSSILLIISFVLLYASLAKTNEEINNKRSNDYLGSPTSMYRYILISYPTSFPPSFHASLHASFPTSFHPSLHASFHTSLHASFHTSFHPSFHTSFPTSLHASFHAIFHTSLCFVEFL